jgi:transposase
MLDHKLEPKPSAARRIEVFTGTGRRRRWSSDEKARILEETLAAGAVVSEVARRHGITSQQLFGWRRSARNRAIERAAEAPDFAPVMLEAPAEKPRPSGGAVLEIVVGAMVARIPLTADGATLARIVRALKAAS